MEGNNASIISKQMHHITSGNEKTQKQGKIPNCKLTCMWNKFTVRGGKQEGKQYERRQKLVEDGMNHLF